MTSSAAVWRSSSEILGRALRAASTWIWAQQLSANAFGALAHAWTVNLLLAQAFGLALPSLLLREATAHPELARGSLLAAVRLRALLFVPELVVFAAIAVLTPLQPLAIYVLLLAGVSLSALQDIVSHFLMARGAWREEAQASLAGSFVVAAASIVLVLLDGDLVAAGVCVIAGNALGLALACRSLGALGETPRLQLDWRSVAPWAIIGMLDQASYHFEILWLDRIGSHESVAHFSAVFRIVGLCAPLLVVAKQLLLPAATRGAALKKPTLLIGLSLGVIASAMLSLLLPLALPMLYPFANAETNAVARHLSWLLPAWFITTGLVQIALGQGRLRLLVLWSAAALVLQIGCLAFTHDAVGAAAAKVFAATVATGVLLWLVR